jgi:ABC-type dipeptide transport system, periplasmic component
MAIADLTQLTSLKSEFGSRFVTTAQPATTGLEMDVAKPPLDKLQVRLALSQSIDRATLNQVVYGGAYLPTTSWLPETVSGAAPDAFQADIGYDPVKAKANLAAAGFPSGAGFPTLKFTIRDCPTCQNLFAFLQKAFKDILNIDIAAEVVDSKTRSTEFNTHAFQLLPGGWIQDYPDPENWIVGLFDTGGGNNGYECSDPEIDANIKKAQFDTNETERIKLYQDINKLIVTRVCGIAPYYHTTLNSLISDKLVGLTENTSGQDSMCPGDWKAEAWGIKK